MVGAQRIHGCLVSNLEPEIRMVLTASPSQSSRENMKLDSRR
jgi:hypothetical protein